MFSIRKSLKIKTFALVAAAGLLTFAAAPGSAGAANSPFTALSGTWSGGGTITMASGTKERIR